MVQGKNRNLRTLRKYEVITLNKCDELLADPRYTRVKPFLDEKKEYLKYFKIQPITILHNLTCEYRYKYTAYKTTNRICIFNKELLERSFNKMLKNKAWIKEEYYHA